MLRVHVDAVRVKVVKTKTLEESTNIFTVRETYTPVKTESQKQSWWINQKNPSRAEKIAVNLVQSIP